MGTLGSKRNRERIELSIRGRCAELLDFIQSEQEQPTIVIAAQSPRETCSSWGPVRDWPAETCLPIDRTAVVDREDRIRTLRLETQSAAVRPEPGKGFDREDRAVVWVEAVEVVAIDTAIDVQQRVSLVRNAQAVDPMAAGLSASGAGKLSKTDPVSGSIFRMFPGLWLNPPDNRDRFFFAAVTAAVKAAHDPEPPRARAE